MKVPVRHTAKPRLRPSGPARVLSKAAAKDRSRSGSSKLRTAAVDRPGGRIGSSSGLEKQPKPGGQASSKVAAIGPFWPMRVVTRTL